MDAFCWALACDSYNHLRYIIALIGPSRVFLGAHWASDVAGSYIIGAIWLFVLILAYQGVMRSASLVKSSNKRICTWCIEQHSLILGRLLYGFRRRTLSIIIYYLIIKCGNY